MLVELLSETTKLKLVVNNSIGWAVETLVAPLKVVGRLFMVVVVICDAGIVMMPVVILKMVVAVDCKDWVVERLAGVLVIEVVVVP
jgi:hypothetical protein